MILFEEPIENARVHGGLEDCIEVNFEELIDEEEKILFAEEDESNRCLSGFYGGTYSEQGLCCVRRRGDHSHHLSEKDWWGISILWEDHEPEATAHYLERPRRRLFGRKSTRQPIFGPLPPKENLNSPEPRPSTVISD